ncbi:peptide chain release factor N(5)-glutamine methyltransferase [candidate division KSB1 bacterium]|nr:peptide chain release factor N(5)-glutamine methyltransferase [candidate division KSB1 bacterium]
MRVLDLLKSAAKQLQEAGIESPKSDAEWLLAAVLNTDGTNLYLMHERRLQPDERARFDAFLSRRLKREPLQYILGICEFYGFEFVVSPAVLIPRPETELLVEKVVELAAEISSPRIIDLGTGSGSIAVSLAKLMAKARLVATDISTAALEMAQKNAQRHGVAERIEFRLADMTQSETLSSSKSFDIVVSNPPYILETERPSLQPEIRDWEPAAALYVDDDGLKFYRYIIDYCYRCLRAGGWVACEMASQRSSAIAGLFRAAGFHDVQIIKDLAGLERHVIGQRL